MGTGPTMLASALWIGAWLRRTVAPDDVLDALARLAPSSATATLLADVRAPGPDRTWLLLPRPGRTVGWPRADAWPVGPAILLTTADGTGALVRAGHGRWTVAGVGPVDLAALEAGMLTARQARRALDARLAESAGRLETLDLARAATVPTQSTWASALAAAPAGLDPEASAVLHRATLVRDALSAALADDGAAVTSGEAGARSAELRGLAGQLEDVLVGVVGGLNPPGR